MNAPTQDPHKRVSSAISRGVASIVARCDTTPGVGRVFAHVSPNWFETDSRYFGFGCVRVSPVIGNRSRLRCSCEVDLQCQIFDEFFTSAGSRSTKNVFYVQFQRNSSKTGVLSCTAQNLICSQEFQPRVPPSSDPLRVSLTADAATASQHPCSFQLWQDVQGTPAQVPLPHLRAQEPDY